MSKIDLTSQQWNDLVFAGRNKSYGAYDMRQNSDNRHLKALIIIFSLVALLIVGFLLSDVIKNMIPEKPHVAIEDKVTMVDLDLPTQELEQPQLEEIIVPPTPLKNTMKFTAPVIKPDAEVKEENKMVTQDEVIESEKIVSVFNVDGDNDAEGAVDQKEIAQATQVAATKDSIYTSVQQMPTYPGGMTQLRKDIAKELRYPRIAEEMGIEGRVIVRFVVFKTGEIGKIQVQRGVDRYLDEEAVRVVSKLKKWIPGKQNGVAVDVYYIVPINFTLRQ
jgi:protein TonB